MLFILKVALCKYNYYGILLSIPSESITHPQGEDLTKGNLCVVCTVSCRLSFADAPWVCC